MDAEKAITVRIYVIPGARKNEIIEILPDQVVRMKITAPPVEGKANEETTRYMQQLLGIKSSQIEIIMGLKNRNKVLKILGITEDYFFATILKAMQK